MSKETGVGIFKCLVLFILMMYILAFGDITVNATTCECGNPYCVYNAKSEKVARKRIMKYVNKYVRKGKYKNFTVKFIRVENLTCEMKESRKQDKVIYVEITKGYVMSKNFDGLTSDGYYISYRGVDDTLKKGAKVKTYCIYHPGNGYIDDIIYRTDRVLNRNKNKKAIRKAKRIFENRFGKYKYQ